MLRKHELLTFAINSLLTFRQKIKRIIFFFFFWCKEIMIQILTYTIYIFFIFLIYLAQKYYLIVVMTLLIMNVTF